MESVIIASVIMASVTYGKSIYGKNIMANETEPLKNTNNSPLVYIKYNVNNKHVFSFPFPFISIYYIFLEFGEIFPQPIFLEVFKYFLLKHLILYVFYFS